MTRQEIETLLEKYQAGRSSAEETGLLESWYLSQGAKLPPYKGQIDYDSKKQELWQAINQKRNHPKNAIYKLWPRIASAASIVLVLGLGWYFFSKPSVPQPDRITSANNDVAPGSTKAILTLADGSQVELNDRAKGTLSMQGNTAVTMNSKGIVRYNSRDNATTSAMFNSITTPRGGEYQLILPDGTHVWLNAASSLKYPVSFTGNERKVELSGEAYFQVAHNKTKPFRVRSGGQTVEVLGTQFNINAYPDENDLRTTLVEGSVKIIKGDKTSLLKPGQQALVDKSIIVREADTDAAIAWKEGRTYFKDADIPAMMRTLSRWYNVEVEYRGSIPARIFSGGVPRSSRFSTMLKILEEINIHAHIEGNKIIVTP